jgi:hypothetical protein
LFLSNCVIISKIEFDFLSVKNNSKKFVLDFELNYNVQKYFKTDFVDFDRLMSLPINQKDYPAAKGAEKVRPSSS